MVPRASGSARGRGLRGFARSDRLRKRFEFRRVSDQGRRVHTKSFVILLRSNNLDHRRLGLTVSAKVGPAVHRNRLKRLLREFFRLQRELFPPAVDIVVIAKAGSQLARYQQVEGELRKAAHVMRNAFHHPGNPNKAKA